MIEPAKLSRVLLIAWASALAGCGGAGPQTPAPSAAPPSSRAADVAAPDYAPAAATSPVSRERALRALTCQVVLAQATGVKMANADTGLPADLESRLKIGALTRWDAFAATHAQAAGVGNQDRQAIVASYNALSATAEDRQRHVDTVRDCLDNAP